MPSAEMLAPQAEQLAVDGQAQGTAEVGRVLIDALAGGRGGPSIDAVIDAVANHGQGGGAAALEALASPADAAVSAWHMAGISGFTAGYSGITMDAMVIHHDAVQSVA